MGKTMTIKALLRIYNPIEIVKEISQNYGTLNFDDCCAVFDTYDELLNDDADPIHRDYASMYRLVLSVVINKESKKILLEATNSNQTIDSRIVRYLFYVLERNGKHRGISKQYVKRVRDFSLCNIVIPDNLTKLDCACIVLLSFAVLNENVIAHHGEITSPEYIRILKSQNSDSYN